MLHENTVYQLTSQLDLATNGHAHTCVLVSEMCQSDVTYANRTDCKDLLFDAAKLLTFTLPCHLGNANK